MQVQYFKSYDERFNGKFPSYRGIIDYIYFLERDFGYLESIGPTIVKSGSKVKNYAQYKIVGRKHTGESKVFTVDVRVDGESYVDQGGVKDVDHLIALYFPKKFFDDHDDRRKTYYINSYTGQCWCYIGSSDEPFIYIPEEVDEEFLGLLKALEGLNIEGPLITSSVPIIERNSATIEKERKEPVQNTHPFKFSDIDGILARVLSEGNIKVLHKANIDGWGTNILSFKIDHEVFKIVIRTRSSTSFKYVEGVDPWFTMYFPRHLCGRREHAIDVMDVHGNSVVRNHVFAVVGRGPEMNKHNVHPHLRKLVDRLISIDVRGLGLSEESVIHRTKPLVPLTQYEL